MSLITIYGGRDMNKEMLEKDYFNDLNKLRRLLDRIRIRQWYMLIVK